MTDPSPPATGTATVTVACKLPNGLILRGFRWCDETEVGPTGSRQVRVCRAIEGESFTVAGNGGIGFMASNLVDLMGRHVPGGFGITHGVPKDLWENWLEFNKDTELVRTGLIFALPSESDVAIEARSREPLRSGLEPIDPIDHGKTTCIAARRINAAGSLSTVQPGERN